MPDQMPLLSACDFTMGQSPSSDTYNVEGIGLPFYQGNADFGKRNPAPRVWCSSPKKTAHAGDILISVRAPIGAINIANEQCCIGRGLAALTVRPEVATRDYLEHYLRYKRPELEHCGTGSTFKAVGKKVFTDMTLPIAPIAEQVEIAKKLGNAIDLQERAISQVTMLDELVKSRFVEMFGELSESDYEGDTEQLSDLAEIVSGITKGRKVSVDASLREVPYMAVSNVKDGYIDWTRVKTIEATDAEVDRYRLEPYDVLMTEGGDPDKLGRGALLIEPPVDCIHQNHVFRVRIKDARLKPEYFEYYLQSPRAKDYFLSCAKRTTGIATINKKQISSLPVVIPSIERQQAFIGFVQQVDKLKFEAQQAIDKLQMLYDSLAQEYFGS